MATRALVLGGGGILGTAWEAGLMKGLAESGFDPRAADLVIGTSAGSIISARLLGGLPADALYEEQRAPSDQLAALIGACMAELDRASLAQVFLLWGQAETVTPALSAAVGRLALAAKTVSEEQWIDVFRHSLGSDNWPAEALAVTAVDAETGELRLWRKADGVPLAAAVASSCAVPGFFPPVTLQGRRYMDGGVRSGTSADLAREHDAVVIVAPLPALTAGIGPLNRRQLEAESESLRSAGRAVLAIVPDETAMAAMGANFMDPTNRTAAAETGLRQGRAVAGQVAAIWSG